MPRSDRAELERLVQALDRQEPDWSSSEIESELGRRAPVSYGNWCDDTPSRDSRLRQVQRWRTGSKGAPPKVPTPYLFLWPMGEKQRQAIEPSFVARPTMRPASHRLFLYNCSEETVRELRAKVGGVEVAFEPALAPHAFAELHWTRNVEILAALLRSPGNQVLHFPLQVEFVTANGRKRSALSGDLQIGANDGWMAFRDSGRSEKEIE